MINARDFFASGVSCLNPQHIRNKYDKEFYTVGCRKCPACVEKRRHSIISRLETLRANSADSFFVTLTFDDHYLPLGKFDEKCEHCSVTSYSLLHRKKTVKDYDITCYPDALDRMLLRRGGFTTRALRYGSHQFGVLLKSDLQKFFKRFRKIFHAVLSQDYHFKYYAVGEYGVQSFRPHFHVIIYCDRPIPEWRLRMFVCHSWPFGRIDVQRVKSSSASYCASYLNASSNVPSFLSVRQFAPFQVCSNGSFFEMWPDQVEKFFKEEFFKVPLLHSVPTNSGYVLRPYSRSTRLQFYPVLSGFYSLDIESLRRRYYRYAKAVEEQGTDDPTFRMTVWNQSEWDTLDVPYSMLYAMSIPEDSKNKRCWQVVSHKDFFDIYVSKKVYELSKRSGIPLDKYVDVIIAFYRGISVDSVENIIVGDDKNHVYDNVKDYCYKYRHYSDVPTSQLPSTSFALSLLRYQYQCMEENVNDLDDLKLYYEQYNNESSQWLYRYGDSCYNIITDDDCFAFSDLLAADCTDNYEFLRGMSQLQSGLVVKHKERNTYYQLEKRFCFI